MDKEKRKNELTKNREAFYEVMGNPLIDRDGVYPTLKMRSVIGCIENKYGSIMERMDASKPSISDFFVDVENIIDEVIDDVDSFMKTYIEGTDYLGKKLRNQYEQKLGKAFRQKGVYPVRRYFTVNK